MIQWNADLVRRLQCPPEAVQEMMPLFRRLLELDQAARREGLGALEGASSDKDDPLLRFGLRLLAEGSSRESLEEILATLLHSADDSGAAFLKRCAIVEGLLSIYDAESPFAMARRLAAYFGPDRAYEAARSFEDLA